VRADSESWLCRRLWQLGGVPGSLELDGLQKEEWQNGKKGKLADSFRAEEMFSCVRSSRSAF